MAKVIGIDLGTTNSCMAVIEGGEPTVIPNAEGGRTTPSVVAFTKDGQRLVGAPAKRQQVTNPENTIFSIKRFMGRKFDEVSEEMKIVPYEVVKGPNDDVRVKAGGKEYAPPEISAMILQKLKADAEAYLGETVDGGGHHRPRVLQQRAARGDEGRRQDRRPRRPAHHQRADRGRRSPTASTRRTRPDDPRLRPRRRHVRRLRARARRGRRSRSSRPRGDNHLGGDNFDKAIVDWMVAEFKQRPGHRPGAGPDGAAAALRGRGEGEDRALVDDDDADQPAVRHRDARGPEAPRPAADAGEARRAHVATLLERTVGPTKQVLADAGLDASKIDHVVLVGGMTRMPAVQEKVKELIGKDPHKGVNPDEVVAIGAAIQAGVLKGEVKDVLLLDVTPLSLGIETKGGIFTKLIERNTTIPTRKAEIFSTAEDNQPSVEIHVLQGESEMAPYNKTLGKFQLVGIPPAPRGMPQIEVAFDIDANGILNVSAKDLGTGNEQQIRIEGGSGLKPDEVEQMMKDAEAHAGEAHKLRELAEARNQAENLVYQTEKSLKEHRESLDESDASTIEGRIMELKEALDSSDLAEIKAKTDALVEASHKLAEAVYAKATAEQAASQPSGDGNGAAPDEDEVVEDADYEVVDEGK